mmetsp:Transcript_8444/g.21118  ORF Transcript_8444/g.21118 Transcript_8444/m.21118 type:complete len:282 (+) Transcript_8444:105-950(+)
MCQAESHPHYQPTTHPTAPVDSSAAGPARASAAHPLFQGQSSCGLQLLASQPDSATNKQSVAVSGTHSALASAVPLPVHDVPHEGTCPKSHLPHRVLDPGVEACSTLPGPPSRLPRNPLPIPPNPTSAQRAPPPATSAPCGLSAGRLYVAVRLGGSVQKVVHRQHKDDHEREQHQARNGHWADLVVKHAQLLLAHEARAPLVRPQRVPHDEHGDGRVHARDDVDGAAADELLLLAGGVRVGEAHQRGRHAAHGHRHAHPRQVGALQGKVGLGLHAHGHLAR